MQKRNKFQRVQLSRKFGINAENSVLIKNMIALKTSDFVKQRDKFSVRTFYSDDRSDFGQSKVAPHLCTTTKKNLFKRAPGLFKDRLYLIVADQIDAKDCKFCGCIWISNDFIQVEIVNGPGTVRRVTNRSQIDYSCKISLRAPIMIKVLQTKKRYRELNCCIDECKKTKLRNVIFEFSYYNVPVGWKDENFICWEITDDGTHKCRLFKE